LTIIESELGMSPSDSVSIANFRDWFISDSLGQRPLKKSLCTILNDLEKEGYEFSTMGGK
jgi:hypothetical protein